MRPPADATATGPVVPASAPGRAPAAGPPVPGPATWVGVDGAVTLFSPRLGTCLGLDGAAAAQLVAAGAGTAPTDPLVRLACGDRAPVGAHVTGPLAAATTGGARGVDAADRAARLQDVLTRAALTPPAGHGHPAWLAWLARHRLAGHLWPVRATLPAALADGVGAAHAGMLERRLRALSDLVAWGAVMEAASVPWLVAKGPVTAAGYPRPDARTWGDLDLLVAPRDLGAALEALAGAGWHLADRNHLLLRRVVPSEVHLVGPSGTVVDLHWSMTSTRVRGLGVGTATADLLARAGHADVGGPVVAALHPGDALVHLCVHAAASGADRLGWLADVAATAPTTAHGWGEVLDAARRWRAGSAVAGVLDRVGRSLGAEVLDGGAEAVVAALRPAAHGAGARVVARAVQAVGPVSASTGTGSAPARLARSWVGIAPGPGDVVRALSGRRRPAFVDAEGEPGSALHASGTPGDLRAFCAEVARRDGAPEPGERRRT